MLYWITFSGTLWAFLPWLFMVALWWWGGWALLSMGFQCPSRKNKAILAFGTGMMTYIWVGNLVTRWIQPKWGFFLPALLIALIGAWIERPFASSIRQWLNGIWDGRLFWGVTILLVGTFFEIEMGLLIFDHHKNLSLISTMAAGNLPPVNFYNPPEKMAYHYAFQFLGASLVREGNLFPWIAFAVAKAITLGYGIMLGGVVVAQCLHPLYQRLITFSAIVLGSGTRYLLLLIPPFLLRHIPSIASSSSLLQWRESGAPLAYPEAFMSGLKYPLLMGHAGPSNLSLTLFFMVWHLGGRWHKQRGVLLMTLLLSVWALAWESSYALVMLGVATLWVLKKWQKRSRDLLPAWWRNAAALSFGIALVQGGTLTQMAYKHVILRVLPSAAPPVTSLVTTLQGGEPLFAPRWPPAVLSSHIGALSLFVPTNWIVIVAEAGIGIILLPWIVRWVVQKIESGQFGTEVEIYAWAAGWGLLFPIFVRYAVDRDISRLTSFGLMFFLVMLSIAFWEWANAKRQLAYWAGASLALMAVPGVVLGGIQLSAIQRPRFGASISQYDVEIARQVWDRLPPKALIFDPRGWPAVAITGRLTRFGIWKGHESTMHHTLTKHPTVNGFLAAGFSYVYVPDEWWYDLTPEDQHELSRPCIIVVAESQSPPNAEGRIYFRRLLDISKCGRTNTTGG